MSHVGPDLDIAPVCIDRHLPITIRAGDRRADRFEASQHLGCLVAKGIPAA
jgi:hypothetical protein